MPGSFESHPQEKQDILVWFLLLESCFMLMGITESHPCLILMISAYKSFLYSDDEINQKEFQGVSCHVLRQLILCS